MASLAKNNRPESLSRIKSLLEDAHELAMLLDCHMIAYLVDMAAVETMETLQRERNHSSRNS